MKRLPLLVSLLAAAAASLPAVAGDVSVSVGQPGYYGRIEIGNAPPPQLLYNQPVIVEQAPEAAAPPPPVYLYVPPYQARHWRRYCHRYGVCGQPVYFVQQSWYDQVYAPRYRQAYAPPPPPVAYAPPPRAYGPAVLYAHDIHADVVRARVIRAHDVHAETLHVRAVYNSGWDEGAGGGTDIHAPSVESSEIHAHDIHAQLIEADALYVHDLHANQ